MYCNDRNRPLAAKGPRKRSSVKTRSLAGGSSSGEAARQQTNIKLIALPLSHSVLWLIDSLLKASGFPSKASGKDKITKLFALTLCPFVVGWQTLDCGSQVNPQFPDSFLE